MGDGKLKKKWDSRVVKKAEISGFSSGIVSSKLIEGYDKSGWSTLTGKSLGKRWERLRNLKLIFRFCWIPRNVLELNIKKTFFYKRKQVFYSD